MATATRTKPNPTHFILVDEDYKAVIRKGSEAELKTFARELNKNEGRTRYYVIGKSWGNLEENPMSTATKNPSEPTGAATERVVTYFRTPAHKKGREWLERELGQMRLFEYNPAHLSVEKIGAKYGVLLNSQVLRRDLTKSQAGQIVKELKTRAAKIQKKNPSDTAIAADVADGLIDIFDVSGDGDIDSRDVQLLDNFEPDEPQLVVDAENELTGEILTKTVDGDVVIEWADGKTTIEDENDLAIENGFKSWRLRRKAARQYKKGLKYEEGARKARSSQSKIESELKQNPSFHAHKQPVINLLEILGFRSLARQVESGVIEPINALYIAKNRATDAELKTKIQGFINQFNYRQNPDLLSTFANFAVGTAAALEVKDKLSRTQTKGKAKKRTVMNTTTKKRNPSFSQLIATARKAGKSKVAILVANIEKVKEYARQNGGSIRRHGIRYFYHLPKLAKNPAAITPRKKVNPKKAATVKPQRKKSNVITRSKKSSTRSKSVNVRAKSKSPAVNNRGKKPRFKRNDAFADFQGRSSTKDLQLITPAAAPRRLWTLGKLLEIKVIGYGTLDLRRAASGKTFYLCSDERNKQLWIAGGRIAEKDSTLADGYTDQLGEIVHIVYETEKTHLGDNGVSTPYIHKMGEEGGKRPTLELDNNGFAYIVGGSYRITPLGIAD